MKKDQMVSDEFLHAFVDDQLDAPEKDRAFNAVEQDEALKARVCELRGLKEMMQHAYEQPPAPPCREAMPQRRKYWQQGLAASLVLALGAMLGWVAHGYQGSGGDRVMLRMMQASQRNGVSAEPQKIIVHVGTSNPVRLKTALDETESLLESSRRAQRELQVEIIANGGGVDLLRADVSPYARRISQMREQYPNLGLVVCGQTLGKLKEKGIEVKLLPHTGVATSAVDQITRRLHQGWDYIKV